MLDLAEEAQLQCEIYVAFHNSRADDNCVRIPSTIALSQKQLKFLSTATRERMQFLGFFISF